MYLLIVLALVITNVITYQITKEVMQNKYRRKLKERRRAEWKAYIDGEEGLTKEEIAAKRVNEALPISIDDDINKQFKLASLVVEHEDGYVTVEDHFLIDDEGETVTLTEFREDGEDIEWMLDSWKVLQSITANKSHEIIGGDSKERIRKLEKYKALFSFYREKYPTPKCKYTRKLLKKWDEKIVYYSSSLNEIERFSDFYKTLTNCIGGRHGKDKIKVKDAFIVFVDLCHNDMDIIANMRDDDIALKKWNSRPAIYDKQMKKEYRKKAIKDQYKMDFIVMEGVISDMEDRLNNIENGIIGQVVNNINCIAEAYEEAAPTLLEAPKDDLADVNTFYAVVNESEDIKTFYPKSSDIVEVELIDTILEKPSTKKSSKAIKKANKIKKKSTINSIAKTIYESTGYIPVKSLNALMEGGEF